MINEQIRFYQNLLKDQKALGNRTDTIAHTISGLKNCLKGKHVYIESFGFDKKTNGWKTTSACHFCGNKKV